jgi:hypothetical protein
MLFNPFRMLCNLVADVYCRLLYVKATTHLEVLPIRGVRMGITLNQGHHCIQARAQLLLQSVLVV